MIAVHPWYADARCRNRGVPAPRRSRDRRPPVDMTPDPAASREVLLAKQQCLICPVRATCGAHAVDAGEYGVWGGLTEVERARLRLGHRTAECAGCGLTYVGPDGESTCDSCARLDNQLYKRVEARAVTARMMLVNLRQKVPTVAVRLALDEQALADWCRLNLTQRQASHSLTLSKGPQGRKEHQPCGTEAARVRHRRALKAAGLPTSLADLDCACRPATRPAAIDGAHRRELEAARKRKKNETQSGKAGQGMAA